MKINFYNVFVTCFLAFSSFVIFGDKYLSIEDNNRSEDLMSKGEAISMLCSDYNAKNILFSRNSKYDEILTNTVVLDSLLINTYAKSGEYFVKVAIQNEENNVINADLKCDESTFKKINSMQNTTLIIAADIKKYIHNKIPMFLDTYNQKNEYFELFDEIKFEGECLEVIEVSILDS